MRYWKRSVGSGDRCNVSFRLIDEPGFKCKLRKAYPEAIGGEMEAAGIYSAAMLERRVWIVVKAVCDYADGHKCEDKDAHQAWRPATPLAS